MFPTRALPILLLAALVGATPARALLIFNVDATTDEPDAVPGDGDCVAAPSGACTLRAAIQEANAQDQHIMIFLEDREYTLSMGGAPEDGAATGDLDILNSPTVVIGAGAAETTIRTVLNERVFDVRATGELVLADVTVQEGLADRGGGIRNLGRLIMERVTVQQNLATFGGGVYHDGVVLIVAASTIAWNGGQIGGGIALYGLARIDGSTIHDNLGRSGGGIFGGSEGESTLVNVTISGNRASQTGGGIQVNERTVIRSSTITGNVADDFGGGIDARFADVPVELASSIVAGNGAGGESPDCDGDVTLDGPNLIQDATGCTFAGDVGLALTGVVAGLEPLASSGGSVPTHGLVSTSPAVDAGPAGGCVDEGGDPLDVDARGEPRGADGLCDGVARCDLGAFERPASRDDDADGAIDAGCPAGTDCDDAEAAVHPGVLDVCNGVDDDCSGAPDDALGCSPLSGALNLRDDDARSLAFKGRQPGLALGERGTAADPTCGGAAGGGALLEVFGLAGSGQSTSVALPCERWSAKERGGRIVAYAYVDPAPAAGACRTVRVTARGVVAKCGDGLDLTDAGERRVGLTLGTGGTVTAAGMRQYCAELGGRVRRDDATRFVAAKAAAPGVCPTRP